MKTTVKNLKGEFVIKFQKEFEILFPKIQEINPLFGVEKKEQFDFLQTKMGQAKFYEDLGKCESNLKNFLKEIREYIATNPIKKEPIMNDQPKAIPSDMVPAEDVSETFDLTEDEIKRAKEPRKNYGDKDHLEVKIRYNKNLLAKCDNDVARKKLKVRIEKLKKQLLLPGKPVGGRPTKESKGEETRCRTIPALRVTIEENEKFIFDANRCGLSKADYQRKLLSGAKIYEQNFDLLKVFNANFDYCRVELSRIGANANQIAKRANRDGYTTEIKTEWDIEMKKLYPLIKELLPKTN